MGFSYISADGGTVDNPFRQDSDSAAPEAPSAPPEAPAGFSFIPSSGGEETLQAPRDTGGWGDVGRGLTSGLKAEALGLAGAVTGNEDIRQAGATAAQEQQLWQARAGEAGVPQSIDQIHGIGDIGKFALSSAAQAAPQIAAYGVGSLGGLPGLALAYGADVAARTGEAESQRALEGTKSDLASSAIWSMPTAALDIGGSGAIVKGGVSKAVAEAVGGGLIRRGLTGAATEAGEQAGIAAAQYGTSTAAQGKEPTLAGYGEAAAAGAAMGGAFGAVHGVKAPIKDKTQGSTDLIVDQSGQGQLPLTGGEGEAPAGRPEAGPQPPEPPTPPAADAPIKEKQQYARDYSQYIKDSHAFEQAQSGAIPFPKTGEHIQPGFDFNAPEPKGPAPEAPAGRWAFPRGEQSQMALDLTGGKQPTDAVQAQMAQESTWRSSEPPEPPLPPAAPPWQRPAQGELPLNEPAPPVDPSARLAAAAGVPPAPPPTARPIVVPGAPELPPRTQQALDIAQRMKQGRPVTPAEQFIAHQELRRPPDVPQIQVPGGPGGAARATPPAEPVTTMQARTETPTAETAAGAMPAALPADITPGNTAEAAKPVPSGAPVETPWQDKARAAWKKASGNMQGFAAAMKDILKAPDAESAAALIRDKMNDKSGTAAHKLDAMHAALTGEDTLEYALRTEGERYATQERKQQQDGEQQHQGNGEGGPPAEAGGGGGNEQGRQVPGEGTVETVVRTEEGQRPAAPAEKGGGVQASGEGEPAEGGGAAAPDTTATGRDTGTGSGGTPAESAGPRAGAAERIKSEQSSDTGQLRVAPGTAAIAERFRKAREAKIAARAAEDAERQARIRELEARPVPKPGGEVRRGVTDTRGEIELREHNNYPQIPLTREEGGKTNPVGMNEAQNHVVDYMNGKITRSEVMQRLMEWAQSNPDVKYGHINGVTQRMGALTNGEIESILNGTFHSPWEHAPGTETKMEAMPQSAIEQVKKQMPEVVPGADRYLKGLEHILATPEDHTPSQRAQAVQELEYLRQAHNDPAWTNGAKNVLDTWASKEERKAVQAGVEEQAKENLGEGIPRQQAVGEAEPHDTALYAAAGDRPSAHAALDHIIENHPDLEVRALAAEMKSRIGEGVEVRHATPEERASAPANTVAEWKNGEVVLHNPAEAGQSVVHEVVHGASERALEAGGKAALAMRKLFAQALKEKALLGEYGLTNVKEFMAEAFSNPVFRAKLEAAKGNLWRQFKDAVRSLLGMERKTMLDRVMEAGRGVMDDQAKMSFSHGDGSRESLYRQISTGTATGMSNAFADAGGRFMEGIGGDLKDIGKKVFIGSMPSHIIARTYKRIVPSIERVAKVMDQRKEYIGKLQERANDVYERVKGAYKQDRNLEPMHQVMSDTQRGRVDPATISSETAQAGLAKAVEAWNAVKDTADKTSLDYLRAKDKLAEAQAAVNARSGWQKLGTASKDAAKAMYKALSDMHTTRMAELKAMMGEEMPFMKKLAGPYAPLKRDGAWVVSAKSQAFQDAEAALTKANEAHGAAAAEYREKQAAADAAKSELAQAKAADRPAAQQRAVAAQAEADAAKKAMENFKPGVKDASERIELMMRDGDHRSVIGARNSTEAAKLAAELKKTLGAGHDVHAFTRDDLYKQQGKHRDAMVTDLLNKIDQKFGDQSEELKRLVHDTYIDHLPDGSAATINAHRQMVHGWNTDFSKATIERLGRDAFQIGTIKYALPMKDSLADLHLEAKQHGSMQANQAYTEMAKRSSHEQNYDNYRSFADTLTKAGHQFYLGLSPMFLAMNMLQTPMIAVPVMAARHGFMQAMAMSGKAAMDIHDMTRLGGQLDFEKGAKGGKINARELDAMRRIQRMGLVDQTIAQESRARIRNLNPQTGLEKAGAGYENAREALIDKPIQHIETLNRGGTGLAAYRMESAKLKERNPNMSADEIHEKATDYAIDVLRDSHVDYSSEANPTMFRSPAGRVLLQFKKYGFSMAHMVINNMADATGRPFEVRRLQAELAGLKEGSAEHTAITQQLADMKERRAEARKMMVGLFGMHQLIAGSLGLPFASTGFAVADAIRNALGDPEDKHDTATDMQNYLTDAYGATAAAGIMRGLPAVLGVDFHRRGGMGDILPFQQQIGQVEDSASGGNPNLMDTMLTSLAGPSWGMGKQVQKGVQKMWDGDYVEGAATMMPRWVHNAWQGAQQSGMLPDQAGGVMVGGKPVTEPLNGSEAFMSFFNIPSTRIQEAKDAALASKEAKNVFSTTRNELVKKWADAQASGDGMPDAVASFNARNPDVAITRGDVLKHQQAAKAGVRAAGGGATGARLRQIGQEESRFVEQE